MRNFDKFILIIAALSAFCILFAGCAQQRVTRYGSVIGLRGQKLEEYKELHANVWPGVLKKIKECNISNYSIYLSELQEDKYYLFGYFEYTGDDYEADMAKMAADPTIQKWWTFCEPCQIPIPTRKKGEWWADMQEVFHQD
jgi:L-rhamnose mutarotase